jgi:hypothetical protein
MRRKDFFTLFGQGFFTAFCHDRLAIAAAHSVLGSVE